MNEVFAHLAHDFELPLKKPVLVFSLILIIVLLSPIVLRKLRIPGIIGLILSGIMVGPNGFNILEKNSAVDLFATIGLLYIMFIAGLELDMGEFRHNRNKSLLFGLITFALPLAVGYPACRYLLQYSESASFLTASMFATHTLVAYPIASRLGISKNQAVAVTVGGTILTDTAVLIILAVIIESSKGTLTQAFWIRLAVSLSIFSAFMFLVVPRIARWFFQKMEGESHAHYIFVLLVVFMSAFLSEVAGVEPIIGAFVAGLSLNKLIPHASPLMNRIEFIGGALFIPVFLLSVGMLVDIRVLFNGPQALVVAAVLTAVALLGKWLAASATQLLLGYSKTQRMLIFGLSSAHAAATLAIILIGFRMQIIDANILNGTIILILITCIVASFATEKASKALLIAEDADQDAPKLAEEHILLPIAAHANTNRLLEFGLLIKDKKSANPITMLSVVPNNEEAEANIRKAKAKLDEFAKQGASTDSRVGMVATIEHNVATGISRIAKEIMADIVVLGWPLQGNAFSKRLADKMLGIIDSTDKNIMVCYLEQPIIIHKRIVVLAPEWAEKESGFATWIKKILKVAAELGLPLVHFGHEKTYLAIAEYAKKMHVAAAYKPFALWENPQEVFDAIQPEDLIVQVMARPNSVSASAKIEGMPARLERRFPHQNKILVYPQQYEALQDAGDPFFGGGMAAALMRSSSGIETVFQDPFPERLYEETQRQRNLMPWLLIALIWGLSVKHLYALQFAMGVADWLVLIGLPAFITLLLASMSLHVYITNYALCYQFFPWHIGIKSIPFKLIKAISIQPYNTKQENFAGWGIGYLFDGQASSFTMSGRKQLEILLEDDTRIYIGMQYPEQLLDCLPPFVKDRLGIQAGAERP